MKETFFYLNSTRPIMFKGQKKALLGIYFILLYFPVKLNAQVVQQQITIDSANFTGYIKKDSVFSNYLSLRLNAVYRKVGSLATSTLQEEDNYRILVTKGNQVQSKLSLKGNSASLAAFEATDSSSTISATANLVSINAKGTWFNGEWLRLPRQQNNWSTTLQTPPMGAVFFNTVTNSLYTSLGDRVAPASWEYYDSNDIRTPIPTKWASDFSGSNNLPVFRLRHPKNVSGYDLGNISLERDFLIMPYEYGISVQYNGVEEHHVGEFSVHRGLNWQGQNNVDGGSVPGWGGILWVGDDNDFGGLRATSRFDSINGGQLKWSEISSEKFSGLSHGSLRFRVVNEEDQIQFLQGTRGSDQPMAYLQNVDNSTILGIKKANGFAIKTNDTARLVISQNGNTGLGTEKPEALLDIKSPIGIGQLRLQTPFTPSGTKDATGKIGELAWDNNYLYIKTATGWMRADLKEF